MISSVSAAAGSLYRFPSPGSEASPRLSQRGQDNQPTDNSPPAPASARAARTPLQTASETKQPQGPAQGGSSDGEQLSEEESSQVRDLKRADAEVRTHEQAHSTAGGPYAGAPSFKFATGPDGKRYAVSGEVEIDSAPVRGNPEATLRKMDVVIRAALAPSDPSSQDLAVARQAQAQRAEARNELFKQSAAERNGDSGESAGNLASEAGPSRAGPAEAAAAYTSTAEGSRDAGNAVASLAEDIFSAIQGLSIVA